jgi:hypothetical protein
MIGRGRRPVWSVLGAVLLAATVAGCSGVGITGSAGASGSSGSGSTGSGEVQTEHQQKSYEQPIAKLVLDSDSGDVAVSSGPDGRADVQRTLRWTTTKPEITEQVDGDTLKITARCPNQHGGRCEVDFTIVLPAAAAVDATLRAGDIDVADLAGDQQLTSSAVDARSSTGDVEVLVPHDGQQYSVRASTSAGSRTVQVADDPAAARQITAQTSAGAVTIGYR